MPFSSHWYKTQLSDDNPCLHKPSVVCDNIKDQLFKVSPKRHATTFLKERPSLVFTLESPITQHCI